MGIEQRYESREHLLLELIRALLALAGHPSKVSVITPDGTELLCLCGTLTRPTGNRSTAT